MYFEEVVCMMIQKYRQKGQDRRPHAISVLTVLSMIFLLLSGCTVKRELAGENDNEVKELIDTITPLLQYQKLLKGMELVTLLQDIQRLSNAATTTETDDAYPGTTPTASNTTGACYIDNKGGVSGFDLCCYALIETECANVASVLVTSYDITFVAGANTASACTGNGFSTAYNSGNFRCYLK